MCFKNNDTKYEKTIKYDLIYLFILNKFEYQSNLNIFVIFTNVVFHSLTMKKILIYCTVKIIHQRTKSVS